LILRGILAERERIGNHLGDIALFATRLPRLRGAGQRRGFRSQARRPLPAFHLIETRPVCHRNGDVRARLDVRYDEIYASLDSIRQWLERLIQGNIVPDFPLCNKSVNGSYSGHDL
jgi:Ni,Fe-hydrogenase III large subunit